MNLKKRVYYLGIALCLASPLAFGICMLIGLDNTIPLSLMITSNVCRICSLEAEMTENTMRSDKAKSQYEALTMASILSLSTFGLDFPFFQSLNIVCDKPVSCATL